MKILGTFLTSSLVGLSLFPTDGNRSVFVFTTMVQTNHNVYSLSKYRNILSNNEKNEKKYKHPLNCATQLYSDTFCSRMNEIAYNKVIIRIK